MELITNNCPDIGIEIVILNQHFEAPSSQARCAPGLADNMMEGDQVLEHLPRLLSP